jgi:hypothetical protein
VAKQRAFEKNLGNVGSRGDGCSAAGNATQSDLAAEISGSSRGNTAPEHKIFSRFVALPVQTLPSEWRGALTRR